jgi:hypothetical protein
MSQGRYPGTLLSNGVRRKWDLVIREVRRRGENLKLLQPFYRSRYEPRQHLMKKEDGER